MIHMLFEDNPNSPVSKLLSRSTYGDYIHFAEGNWKLTSKCLEILKSSNATGVYVFIDCPPNNINARRIYSSIYAELGRRTDVEILPIVCIEEVVLEMLLHYYEIPYFSGIESLVHNIVGKFDWNAVDTRLKNIPYINESLEHAYKYILSHLKTKCLYNENSESEGKFYLEDCTCDRKFCKILDCTDTIQMKAERLYSTLPIYIALSDEVLNLWKEYDIENNEHQIEEIKFRPREKFNNICDSMDVARIVI